MLSPAPSKIRSRQISEPDIGGVIDLLATGFRHRSRKYWQRALEQLASHATPAGMPKYGYLLESEGEIVGVILLIFSSIPAGAVSTTRCNVCSWYVKPAFRSYASMLVSQAVRRKNVTYLNVSPEAHTWPIVEAQGFSRYINGKFITVPALGTGYRGDSVKVIGVDAFPGVRFESSELELLRIHQDYGCISLWCATPERAYPFAFLPRVVRRFIACAQLVYCRDINEFVRFSRPLGRFLAMQGKSFVIIDSNGPIPGLIGRYFDGRAPKYFKGPDRPAIGDLAYTAAVMFK